MSPLPQERVSIFVDGSNLYHALVRNFQILRIDLDGFLNYLLGGRDLVRVHYYVATLDQVREPEAARGQAGFLNYLGQLPRTSPHLRALRYVGRKADGSWEKFEKGIDVAMAVELVAGAYHHVFDTAVLVSGDADLVPAVEEVIHSGKSVELATFGPEGTGLELRKAATRVVRIPKEIVERFRIR